MTPVAAAPRLSLVAQTYVAVVAATSVWVLLAPSQAAWAALVVLGLPLSLVAMWVGFYAGLAVGFWTGLGHDEVTLPMGLAWVTVWTAAAWINARLLEKLLDRGWDAVRVRGHADDDEDDEV